MIAALILYGAVVQMSDYPASDLLTGLTFDQATIRHEAPGSDIWPITWADDGHQYTAFGDGGGFGGSNQDGRVSLGVARVEGGPDDYVGHNVWGGKDAEHPAQFAGKMTGILSVDGVLYGWWAGPASSTVPITRLMVSRDHSKTWSFVDWQLTMEDQLFAGVFVQAGQDHGAAPDGFVYACFTHLPEVPTEQRNWRHEVPGQIDLARVPSDQITEHEAWTWYAGNDADGQPRWTADLTMRRPCFADPVGIKVVSMGYQPALQRYLLTYNTNGHPGNFAVFEAVTPWGPWRRVVYQERVPIFQPGPELHRVSIFHFAPAWWSEDGREFTLIFNTADDAWNTVRGRFGMAR